MTFGAITKRLLVLVLRKIAVILPPRTYLVPSSSPKACSPDIASLFLLRQIKTRIFESAATCFHLVFPPSFVQSSAASPGLQLTPQPTYPRTMPFRRKQLRRPSPCAAIASDGKPQQKGSSIWLKLLARTLPVLAAADPDRSRPERGPDPRRAYRARQIRHPRKPYRPWQL